MRMKKIVSKRHLQQMFFLFKDVFEFSPYAMMLTVFFMLARSITTGASLLLIIPLLHVVGFAIGTEASSIGKAVMITYRHLHLPLNLLTVLLGFILIVSLSAAIAYMEQITSSSLQQRYIHYLRDRLYTSILHTSWPFFLQQKISHLLHSLTTQIQMISGANFQLLTLLHHVILLSVYTGLAFLLSGQMTCAAIISAIALLQLMLPLHRLTSQTGHDYLRQNQAIMQAITEQLSAFKMIKGSGFENNFINELHRISSSLEYQNQQLSRMTAITKLIYTMGSVIAFSVLLYFAIKLLAISPASLLLLLFVFARILPMVSAIQQSYQRILHQLPSYMDVKQLLEDCKKQAEGIETSEQPNLAFNKVIQLKNISFHYEGHAVPIIENLSLTIIKNTTAAIIGPSGVGKSTLADLIVGLLEPTAGHIYIDTKLLNKHCKLAWRRSVAYVTQDNFLFNASIRQNLQLLCEEQPDEALWAALQAVSAKEFVSGLNQGLDTIIGDRGIRLSGGERQRLAIARALLTKPQLLVLDESTNSLDRETIYKIQQVLKELHGKMTILIISHQIEMSDFADQKIILPVKQTVTYAT